MIGGQQYFELRQTKEVRKIREFFDLRSSRFEGTKFNSPGMRGLETTGVALRECLLPGGTLIPSWGVSVPRGCFIEVKLAVRIDRQWSSWFSIARWACENPGDAPRTSYGNQHNWFGAIETDTYRNTTGKPVTHWRARVELHGDNERLKLNWMTLQAADRPVLVQESEPLFPSIRPLPVPVESQYAYEGGHEWCAALCAVGVLRYFDPNLGLRDPVGHAVRHLFDERYEGTGNWSFIAAYLSARLEHLGKRAYVRNFSSLIDVEFRLSRGFPVIASLAWDNTSPDPALHLPGGIAKTDGHLLVITGIEHDQVVVMDPATTRADHSDVARAYPREHFERRWLDASNGAAIVTASLP